MRTSFPILLLALLCSSALSAFKAKQSITVSGVTYSIGNNGNDCGVTRTESGTTISWYYTTGAANSGDCTGRNIFVLGSHIGVLLSANEKQNLLVPANSATSHPLSVFIFMLPQVLGEALVFGYIDTSSVSGTFGKFSMAFNDDAFDYDTNLPAPLEYVSFAVCDDKKTVQITVNVKSPYGTIDLPGTLTKINGDGVKQVFNSDDLSLTTYKAADAPFCTKVEEPTEETPSKTTTTAEKSSGIEGWKLILIIALPSAFLAVGTAFVFIKISAKRKASVKVSNFKELPPVSPSGLASPNSNSTFVVNV